MEDRLTFVRVSPQVGVRIGKRWATLEALKAMLGFEEDAKVVVFDKDTNEFRPDEETGLSRLPPDRVYFLSSEDDVEKEEENVPMSKEEFTRMLERISTGQPNFIKGHYEPKSKELFDPAQFDPNVIFDKRIWDLVQGRADNWDEIVHCESGEKKTGLYSFPCLQKDFCLKLIDEVAHYEESGLPVSRPNSMNNYGLILDLIGLRPLMGFIRENLISPLARRFYSPDLIGDGLDSHHSFVVQYEMGGDKKLDFHYDDAEVTLNVCLGRDFEGGDLFFRGLLSDESTHDENLTVSHSPGRALLHHGKHRHGAKNIVSGERSNLIIWCRSSSVRAASGGCSCGHDHGDEGQGHEHDHHGPEGHGHGHDHEHEGECCDHNHGLE